jgi:hypothetical protein
MKAARPDLIWQNDSATQATVKGVYLTEANQEIGRWRFRFESVCADGFQENRGITILAVNLL